MHRFLAGICVSVRHLQAESFDRLADAPDQLLDPSSATFAAGYFLEEARSRGAQCLDGSAPLHYHRKGSGDGTNKWFIWQQGGAWCTSDASCAARALTHLGSTKSDPLNISLSGGYFDVDSSINPLLYNWNAVSLRYCDGASLMGNVNLPVQHGNQTLYYRGKHILEAHLESLLFERGMANATDIVFGGCSAGGLAAYLNCDKFAATVYTATAGRARMSCMPDSGFFVNSITKCHNRLFKAFQTHNALTTVDPRCMAVHNETGEPWKCMFAQWAAPYIKTPTFALQSQFDSWQMGGMNASYINGLGPIISSLVQSQLLISPQHGSFLDSCSHHCGSDGPHPAWGTKGHPGSSIDGLSMGAAVKAWYDQGSTALENRGFYNQNQTYPCDDCCHSSVLIV